MGNRVCSYHRGGVDVPVAKLEKLRESQSEAFSQAQPPSTSTVLSIYVSHSWIKGLLRSGTERRIKGRIMGRI